MTSIESALREAANTYRSSAVEIFAKFGADNARAAALWDVGEDLHNRADRAADRAGIETLRRTAAETRAGAGASGLVEFLLARIAEDEELATERGDHFDPGRVLADCKAKLLIVEWHGSYGGRSDYHLCDDSLTPTDECYILQALGLPYADHPDYREEWKP